MGLKMDLPIKTLMSKGVKDKEFLQTIGGAAIITDFMKRKGIENKTKRPISSEIVKECKKRYAGLSFEILLALWIDSYHTEMAIDDFDGDNYISYHNRHKMLAIAEIIKTKYLVKANATTK